MLVEIKNRWDNKIILCGEYENFKDCLEKNSGANLRGANLSYTNLSYTNLSYTNLSYTNLSYTNLRDANLRDANLSYTNLSGANLSYTNLSGTNLSYTNLRDANLSYANLSYTNLSYTNLRDANLSYTNLSGANLRGAKNYVSNHNFWLEIIRRQSIETFTEKEWAIIRAIFCHRMCWDTIKKEYGIEAMPIFEKLNKCGFGEWQDKYTEVLK